MSFHIEWVRTKKSARGLITVGSRCCRFVVHFVPNRVCCVSLSSHSYIMCSSFTTQSSFINLPRWIDHVSILSLISLLCFVHQFPSIHRVSVVHMPILLTSCNIYLMSRKYPFAHLSSSVMRQPFMKRYGNCTCSSLVWCEGRWQWSPATSLPFLMASNLWSLRPWVSVIRGNSNSYEEKQGVRLEIHVMSTLFVYSTVVIKLRVFRSAGEWRIVNRSVLYK